MNIYTSIILNIFIGVFFYNFKYIKQLFTISIVKRGYWLIYTTRYEDKMYYIKDSMWTTDIDNATRFKKYPKLFWMGKDHLVIKL